MSQRHFPTNSKVGGSMPYGDSEMTIDEQRLSIAEVDRVAAALHFNNRQSLFINRRSAVQGRRLRRPA